MYPPSCEPPVKTTVVLECPTTNAMLSWCWLLLVGAGSQRQYYIRISTKTGSSNNDYLYGCPELLLVGAFCRWRTAQNYSCPTWMKDYIIPHISISLVTAKLFLELLATLKEVCPKNSQAFSRRVKDDGELAGLLVIIFWVLVGDNLPGPSSLHCARA